MSIPCPRSRQYVSRPPDFPACYTRRGPAFTGDVHVDAVLRAFILPPESDPDAFYHTINSMASEAHRFFALLSAVSIRLFDQLTVPVTCDIIMRHYPSADQIPELLQVLCECGFVEEKEGTFVNTPQALVFLTASSLYSQVEYLKKLEIRTHELWCRLPDIIRTGPVYYDKNAFFSRMVLPSMAANALTGRLQQVIRAILELPGIPETSRMLDLGGGHGLYAIALARLNPGMQCVVFDLPQVGEAARISLAKYGVENQVSIRAGDFFRDDFGRGYDLILSSSNPSGKKTEMVPRIADALNPGGYFVNVQGGDASKKNDCVAELECRMWRFSDEPEWRTRDGKRRPFVSDDYREALGRSGMEVISMATVPDPFRVDDSITMLICQKPFKEEGQVRFPAAIYASWFIHAPWEGSIYQEIAAYKNVHPASLLESERGSGVIRGDSPRFLPGDRAHQPKTIPGPGIEASQNTGA